MTAASVTAGTDVLRHCDLNDLSGTAVERSSNGSCKSSASNLLIVVEYGVHVLNPDGVDRSVEHDPLAVERHVPRVLTESVCQHA